jgi:hypothetical protein
MSRHIYLGIPKDTPNLVDQFGSSVSPAFEIPELLPAENYVAYFEVYNQDQIYAYYDKTSPIQSYEDARKFLDKTLKEGAQQRTLVKRSHKEATMK